MQLNSNYPLKEQLNQLKEIAYAKFGIEIDTTKFIDDKSYQDLVLSELGLLNDPDLTPLVNELKAPPVVEEKPAASSQPTAAPNSPNLTWLYAALIAVVLLLLIAIGVFLFQGNGSNPAPEQTNNPVVTTSPAVNTATQPAVAKTEPAQITFRMHGSNTIGEKLAPALLEGYLAKHGAKEFNWQQGESPVERALHYKKAGKNYLVELHAHGSSTGFADILAGKADVAMASRKVKSKEIEKLKLNHGDFSKVGNEHIVGLDGLAIIVNQNNPINHLSTQQLADIFSGKISNWGELGGSQGAITVLARDKNSGTWDTFKKLVLKKHQAKLSDKAQRFESSSELSALVSQNDNAIGFIGLNYILHNKAVAISEGQSTSPIYPTRFTVSTEDYALSRRLYIYTPTSASMFVKGFAQFAISYEGQEIVAKTGLISQNINVENVSVPKTAPAQYARYAEQGQRLSLTFRFEHGSGQLDNKGKRDLHRLLRFLENNPTKRVVLMGFSDNSGNSEKNRILSLQRAKSVAQELSARGIQVYDTQGFGDALPVANNSSQAGRERNRRVEIWIL